MRDAWSFAQLDDFWARYEPLSPWGKDRKDRRLVMTERAAIEESYDDIEAALAWMGRSAAEPLRLERAGYHLRRMPRLPEPGKADYELLELFQIKKFLANYRGLLAAIDEPAARRFDLSPRCAALAAELGRGGSDAETFYLADSYDAGLAEARAGLAAADAALKAAKAEAEALALAELGLAFDGRDFVVAPRDGLSPEALERAKLTAEPYDDGRLLLRLAPRAAIAALEDRRERLYEAEREAENRVLRRLSALAGAAGPELADAARAVARWDLARAGALLATSLGCSRPRLDGDGLELEGGRFVPCLDECAALGLSYEPLDATVRAPAALVFGSNMGGKTVALKTLCFMQLLAQAGLFVPAAAFRTRVYRELHYIGELAGERLAGLSGFGFEVWRFQGAWAARRDALTFFDEPARTTGSHEAEALLSALVEAYLDAGAAGDGSRAVFATHFRGVARLPKAEYWRMHGLDRGAACAGLDADAPLPARLAGINRAMRYRLEPDDDSAPSGSDALAIAAMLGLDCALVERAERYFSGGSGSVYSQGAARGGEMTRMDP